MSGSAEGGTRGSQVALYPNLNVNDEVWRAVLRDQRFRRALSMATNRHELNQVIYLPLILPILGCVLCFAGCLSS